VHWIGSTTVSAVDFDSRADRYVLTCRNRRGRLRARVVLGCDGAASTVRAAWFGGGEISGKNDDARPWLVVDVEVAAAAAALACADHFHFYVGRRGGASMALGRRWRRWEFCPPVPAARAAAHCAARSAVPEEAVARGMRRCAEYRVMARHAARTVRRRVVLLGDAAHVL